MRTGRQGVLAAGRRLVTVARRPGRTTAVVVAGLLAAPLLTTFSAPPPPPSAGTPVAAAPAAPAADLGTVRRAPSPELEGLLSADLGGLASDEAPTIPEIGGAARQLAPFTSRTADTLDDGEVVAADLVLRTDDDAVDLDALAEPLAGATHVAPAAALTATTPTTAEHTTTDAGDGEAALPEPREVSVLGVDGATFRPLTPEVTAAADAVWRRFDEGDVLVSHELAEELGLQLGGTLVLRTDVATVPARVGAFAANGAPPLADVLVPVPLADELGVGAPNTLIVAAGGGDPEELGDALAAATGGEVELRRAPAPPVAERRTTGATPSGRIEPFSYTSRADGRITIHDGWVGRNIVRVQLPGMAATSCHRTMAPQLVAAVEELIARDLYGHLDPSQFAGCFVARHIDWDPTEPLSMHAWGLAVDFNTRENPLGATPRMDPRVVEVFERWGFEWGGRWRRPDGMHFELARIVPTS